MKVLYAEDVQISWNTAKSVQVTKTCAGLKACGVDIRLLALKGTGTLDDAFERYSIHPRFPITRRPRLPGRYVSSMWYRSIFGVEMALDDADIFYTRDLGIAFVASMLRRPFAYEMHSMPVRRQQQWMLRRIGRSQNLIAVFPISHALSAAVARQYGVDGNKLYVVPCAADVLPGLPSEMGGDEKGGDRGRPFRLGYVGHLYAGKGGDLLCELAARRPEIEFHVIGDVAQDELRARFGPNVVLHGSQPHAAAMELLARTDCALAPYSDRTSAVDGKIISDWFSPLKVFEYMAAKRPIICSDLPAIREVLNPGVTALMPPPRDIDAWLEAIDSLRANPALATKMAERAYDVFEREYTYSRRAQKIAAVLKRAFAA